MTVLEVASQERDLSCQHFIDQFCYAKTKGGLNTVLILWVFLALIINCLSSSVSLIVLDSHFCICWKAFSSKMLMISENLPQIPFPTAVHYHADALAMPVLCTFKLFLSNRYDKRS